MSPYITVRRRKIRELEPAEAMLEDEKPDQEARKNAIRSRRHLTKQLESRIRAGVYI